MSDHMQFTTHPRPACNSLPCFGLISTALFTLTVYRVCIAQDSPRIFQLADHYYVHNSTAVSFYRAYDRCRLNGGYLVCLNTLNESRFVREEILTEVGSTADNWVGFNWRMTDVDGDMHAWWYICVTDEATNELGEATDDYFDSVQAAFKTEMSNLSEPFHLLTMNRDHENLTQIRYNETHPFVCEYEGPCFRGADFCVFGTCTIMGVDEPCDCQDTGYTSELCDLEINECNSSPCQVGLCNDQIGSYLCVCTGTGYTGQNCETDIDECALNGSACANGFCVDAINDFSCDCNGTGYEGNLCDEDIVRVAQHRHLHDRRDEENRNECK